MRQIQEQFLCDIYGPDVPDNPEVALYRELTRNTLQEAMDVLFPVTKIVYDAVPRKKDWEELGNEFISSHWPKDIRLFWAYEKFSSWLQAEPSLQNLADYEWARYQVTIGQDPGGEEWLNPTLILRCYPEAIPQWFLDIREKTLKPPFPAPLYTITRVALFRNIQTEEVRVLELHEAAFELLSCWISGEAPDSSASTLAEQLNQPLETIRMNLEPLLKSLAQEGVLLRLPRKNTR